MLIWNNGVQRLMPAALQDRLNNMIDGIEDENNENTKLSESSQQWQ